MSPKRSILAVAAAAVLLGAGCSKGSSASDGGASPTPGPRPSSTGVVTIVSPKAGEVIRGSTMQLRVTLTGATIVPATTKHIVPDQGHVHVYLDNQLVLMNFGLSSQIGGLTSGSHTLRVEFVASDHLPFDPRDFKEITFEVKT